MIQFTIKHKYCGAITTIEGNDIFDAFKRNNKDPKIWILI